MVVLQPMCLIVIHSKLPLAPPSRDKSSMIKWLKDQRWFADKPENGSVMISFKKL